MDSDGSQDFLVDVVINRSLNDYKRRHQGSQVMIVGCYRLIELMMIKGKILLELPW